MNDTGKLIIADDEVHILRVLDLKLSSAGFDVVKAHDGMQAWQAINRAKPILLISDYQMPGLNGLELAEKMYQEPGLRDVPIILLTARGFSIDPQDLAQTNIVELMSKPFSPRDLLVLVQNVLNGMAPRGPENVEVEKW